MTDARAGISRIDVRGILTERNAGSLGPSGDGFTAEWQQRTRERHVVDSIEGPERGQAVEARAARNPEKYGLDQVVTMVSGRHQRRAFVGDHAREERVAKL